MRPWSLVFLFLAFALSCRREPPPPRLREVVPRLTGFDGWRPCRSLDDPTVAIQKADCGPANIPARLVSVTSGECNVMMRTQPEAVEMLAHVPRCTDAAVEQLEFYARQQNDARSYSDLSAAYFTRAQRKNQPSDVVRALVAAEKALEHDSTLPQARFNAALAQEALGFSADAIALWDSLGREPQSPWAGEAAEQATRLRNARAVQWRDTIQNLPAAVRKRDQNAIDQLISPFRGAAQNYMEDVVLPLWAVEASKDDGGKTEEPLALAEAIASSLQRLNRDRYFRDVLEVIRDAHNPHRAVLLREGVLALASARKKQREMRGENTAPDYETAERTLTAAGSPLRYTASLGRATALTQAEQFDAASDTLNRVERAARRDNYSTVVARTHSARGYFYNVRGAYLDALAEYGEAQAIYQRTTDTDNLAKVHARQLGLILEVGHLEHAWRHAFRTRRYAASDLASQHLYLGETARAAVAIGHPAIGLRYQDVVVRTFRGLTDGKKASKEILSNLGIALRARAGIRAHMGDDKGAEVDLNEAVPLILEPNEKDAAIPVGFKARLAEVRAQTLPPAEAIRELITAIELAQKTHYGTLQASLLTKRADLHQLQNDKDAALRDLLAAVAALRAEADIALRRAKVEKTRPDPLWSAYFKRPQEAYRRLVARLVANGSDDQAFAYAEEARAYEPLNLLLRRGNLPAAFRQTLDNDKPFDIRAAEKAIPDGTYLLQYSVLDDRTHVWLISHGASERQTLQARNDEIEGWTAALQKWADRRNDAEFRKALGAPYDALLKEPLARIAKLHGDSATLPRIVIVPDRAMHGLPFAALRDGDRYLIRDHIVSTAASATLYAYSLAQDRELANRPVRSVLLVGDPAFDQKQDIASGLEPSTAGLRIDVIERIYERLIQVHRRVRERATPQELLELAPDSAVVHVAAHGVTNPETPLRSYLLLAPAENDSGALDAERLTTELQSRLTRLAVLSACSSAGGTPVGPEGLAPLVRPIITAGIPGVIGTLWNVSSHQETEELLIKFHRHYSQGRAADEALRLAQVEMLDDPSAVRSSPLAWAPFQLTGYASSPFRGSNAERRR